MNQLTIKNLHKQLKSNYDTLAAIQAHLVAAKKELDDLKVSHRIVQRSPTDQDTENKEHLLIEALQHELRRVRNDISSTQDELEDVKTDSDTLANTIQNRAEAAAPAVEELAPRGEPARVARRARFVEEKKMAQVSIVPLFEES